MPSRLSDNDKRRLDPAPDVVLIARLCAGARYRGSPKHKAAPAAFGLPIWTRPHGDATLCDAHAGFTADQADSIPRILKRGIAAGLLGQGGRILWTIGDDGWIFEGRVTNEARQEYHAYPVRPSEAIARPVYERYAAWAQAHGDTTDREAQARCRDLYGFKP